MQRCPCVTISNYLEPENSHCQEGDEMGIQFCDQVHGIFWLGPLQPLLTKHLPRRGSPTQSTPPPPPRAGEYQAMAGCQWGKGGWSVPSSLVTLHHVQTGFGRGPQSPRWHLILSCHCLQQSHPDTVSTQLLCHLRGGHITPRSSTRKS